MRNHLTSAAAFMFVAFSAFAETVTYNWVGGENGSWADSKSFSPEGNPGAEDDVLLPKNVVVKLNAKDDAEWEAFNRIRRVRADDDCFLEVDIGENDREMQCAFTFQAHEGRNRGKLIKKGTGSLWLMSARPEFKSSNGIHQDYYANFDVVEGALKFPQDAVGGTDVKIGNVCISNNAAFYTLATSDDALAHTYVRELWGEPGSLVTNTAPIENSKNQMLWSNGDKVSIFAGRLCAPIRWRSGGYVHLTGVENTIVSTFTQSDNKGLGMSGQHVGIAKFGKKGELSSIGTSGSIYARENGGAFKYIGTGEETDANFEIGSEAAFPYPGFLSGGDVGGLIWTGLWYLTAGALQQRLVICGDGATPNVMKGAIQGRHYDGEYYSFFIRKQGKGIWRIEDSSKGLDTYYQMRGVWGVDEGTLQFTSLAEKGFISSLGIATELFKDYCGAKEESMRASYAFTLGGDSTEGALEYVGDKDEFCSDRNVWLYGDGAFVNNASSKIRFRGVSSVTGSESPSARSVKFTVRGESTAENEILDITDSAERPISVVKDGAGTWVLGGEQSFRGSLAVKNGKLIVRRPEKYTWFRWTITSKYSDGTATSGRNALFSMQEFALFDNMGMRQNYGLALNSNYASLKPGEVAYGTDKTPYIDSCNIDGLFDDSKKDPSGWLGIMRPPNSNSGIQTPEPDKPFSWIPIVMRISNNANDVTSYDVVFYHSSSHLRSVASYFVDGSLDGVNWDRLSTVESINPIESNNTWQYRGTSFGDGDERTKPHANGCPIASAPAKLFDVLNNVKSVSVNSGAELVFEGDIVIPALSFDCEAGGGTFSGCKFAEKDGSIDIYNVPDGSTKIDFGWTFNGCSGVENIKGWAVLQDGVETSRYSISVQGGNKVVAVRTGLRMVIR
ncbi:MAG: autotransporter-associated beta strand repeat-containing protein [Kiritimatiellae bacterium]|nr:autotransporter-associated beta strand repeat-containing protein [Kiritimatiellia bacterium]